LWRLSGNRIVAVAGAEQRREHEQDDSPASKKRARGGDQAEAVQHGLFIALLLFQPPALASTPLDPWARSRADRQRSGCAAIARR
jgi:hypothetical protein